MFSSLIICNKFCCKPIGGGEAVKLGDGDVLGWWIGEVCSEGGDETHKDRNSDCRHWIDKGLDEVDPLFDELLIKGGEDECWFELTPLPSEARRRPDL